MENFTDYYRVLRVGYTADDATIKTAFRRLARRYHPDVASTRRAADRFRQARQAYEVLSDRESRRAYDEVYRARRVSSRRLRGRAEPREIARRPSGKVGFVVTLDLLGLRVGVTTAATRRRRR